jgi:hypothetical protein
MLVNESCHVTIIKALANVFYYGYHSNYGNFAIIKTTLKKQFPYIPITTCGKQYRKTYNPSNLFG